MKMIVFSTRSVLLLLLLSAAGCQGVAPVELYTVSDVSPDLIEPGDVLIITGDGFVEGPARVGLNGEFRPEGQVESERREVVLSGKAVSPERIEVPIPSHVMRRIAVESQDFHGEVIVSFPSVLEDSVVALEARSPVLSLQLRPAGGGVRAHAAKVREAKEVLRHIGVRPDTEEAPEVVVKAVDEDGEAARCGVAAGDRLIALDGFPITSAADLSGLSTDEEHRFEFVSASGTVIEVKGFTGRTMPLEPDEFLAVILTAALLGVFLAFMLPAFFRAAATPIARPAHPFRYLAGFTLAAVLSVVVPAVVITFEVGVSGTVVLVLLHAALSVLILLYGEGPLLVRVLNTVLSFAVLCALVGLGAVAGNSLSLTEVTRSQAGAHLALHVWRNPLYMGTVVLAIFTLWPVGLTGRRSGPVTGVAGFGLGLIGAIAVVFFCLGGWMVPGLSGEMFPATRLETLLAIAVFAVKTWLVVLAARAVVGADRAERRTNGRAPAAIPFIAIPTLLLGAGAIVLEGFVWEDDLAFAGQVLSAGTFFTLVSLFVTSRVLRHTGPARPEVAQGAR